LNKSNEQWKLLVEVPWVHEAQLIRSLLEGSEISCFIPDENTGIVNPIMTMMRIRVMVLENDFESAQEILEHYRAANHDLTDDDQATQTGDLKWACPAGCKAECLPVDRSMGNWVVALLGLIGMAPMKSLSKKFRCSKCQKIF
jgi:hypothetical protein